MRKESAADAVTTYRSVLVEYINRVLREAEPITGVKQVGV